MIPGFPFHDASPLPLMIPAALLIAGGNALEAMAGFYLLRRFVKDKNAIVSPCSICKFVGITLLVCMAGTTIVLMSLCLLRLVSWDMVPALWAKWWIGDVAGVLSVTPLIFVFYGLAVPRIDKRGILEFAFYLVVLFAMNAVIFGEKTFVTQKHVPLAFLIFPAIVLGVCRFGLMGMAATVLVMFMTALKGTVAGYGPFGGFPLNEGLLLMQSFVGVVSVTGLTLAAVLHEQRQSQDRTYSSEQRYRYIVEAALDAVISIDEHGRIIEWNRQAEITFGWPRQEVMGRPLVETIIPPALREAHVKGFQRYLETGEGPFLNKRIETNALHRDGHEFLIELSISPLRLEDRIVFSAFLRDITERKKAESALQESESRFRQMANTAPVMIWMSGGRTGYVFFNKAWLDFTGRTLAQELGSSWIQGIHPGDYARYLDVYKTAFNSRERFTIDYRLKRYDGQYRWMLCAGVPRFAGQGRFEGFVGTCVDITERKQAEEILKRDKETLSVIIENKTQELLKTQADLKQVNRLADIGTLAATVAHELRNPLGVIQMAAYNLRRKYVPDNKHLTNIEKKVMESNQIISNLLNYSSIKKPHYEKFCILEVVEECIASLKIRHTEKNIELIKKYDVDMKTTLEADPLQIREILSNILSNAFQALENSSGRVTIAVLKDEPRTLRIVVSDNGAGITNDDLKRVFQPFFTRRSKGTGLGLTICNELIHMHGGTIGIESEKDQGTHVTVSLPLVRS